MQPKSEADATQPTEVHDDPNEEETDAVSDSHCHPPIHRV